MQNPESILVTGACGFVGSTLIHELSEQMPNVNLYGIDNLSRKGSQQNAPALKAAGCQLTIGDIRNPQHLSKIPKVDWVIDCAANPSVLAGVDGISSSFDLMDHNLVGTIQILEFCKQHQAGFILISTNRVYSISELSRMRLKELNGAYYPEFEPAAFDLGGSGMIGTKRTVIRQKPLTTEGVTEVFSTAPPLSLYGMSKLCSEGIAMEYGSTFGFPVWINRCGVLAGAGQFGKPDQGIFSYWIHSWAKRRPLKYIGFSGEGFQVRDCLHPKDLMPLLNRQMRESKRNINRIINVAGGVKNAMSLRQLSDWCTHRFGPHQVSCDRNPRPFDIPWMVLDSSMAKELWNWEPFTPIANILEEIAQHAEENPHWLDTTS
ncbi:MAG: NAD-dependent epimerase/dehydratase family protein [Verrucomicrobiota bacterium]